MRTKLSVIVTLLVILSSSVLSAQDQQNTSLFDVLQKTQQKPQTPEGFGPIQQGTKQPSDRPAIVPATGTTAAGPPAGQLPLVVQQGQPNNVGVPPGPAPTVQQPQPAQRPAAVSQPGLQPANATPQAPPGLQPANATPQAPPGLQPIAPQMPPAPQPQPVAGPRPTPQKRGEVSFNFDDADVYAVIQTIFGDVLRFNYVVDPSVKGRVTFRSVSPIPKDDVLPLMEVILRLNGIGIVEESGLYRIVPISDIAREPAPVGIGRSPESVPITGKAVMQVVPVKFVQSSEIVKVLTPFLSKNAVIVDVSKSNYIIMVDTDANVRRLLQLVDIFDSDKIRKIKPEVFVYPVQNGKAKDVAAMLNQIFLGVKPPARATTPATPARPGQPQATPTPSTGPTTITSGQEWEALVSDITRIFADEVTNSVVILATPDDYDLIATTIQKIDIVPRQVMIEALVAAVGLTDNLNFGVSWLLNTDINITGLKPFVNPIQLPNTAIGQNTQGLTVDPATQAGFTLVAKDPTGNVRATIVALAEAAKAKVLSAPHVMVSDNREARIQVGDQIPIATSTTSTPVGGVVPTNTTTSTIQYVDTGTILKVKPQVNDSGLVSLEISQEVSSAATQNVLGTQQYVITKRQVTTNLVAQDGETIVIGGLIGEESSKSRSGIPILKDLPILGYLFGSTVENKTRTELIVLLTPRVVKSQQEAKDVSKGYFRRFRAGASEKDVDPYISGALSLESKQKPADAPGNVNGGATK